MPHYRLLDDMGGLGEVRLQGNVAWRIFGFRRTFEDEREFVITNIGNHKGKIYKPKKVLEQAAKRMKEIQDDPSTSKRCVRPE